MPISTDELSNTKGACTLGDKPQPAHQDTASTFFTRARISEMVSALSDLLKPSSKGSRSSSAVIELAFDTSHGTQHSQNPTQSSERSRENHLRNNVFTHSVLAFPSMPSPNTRRYKPVSIKLNRFPSSVKSKSGFCFGAVASRSFRAFAAVSMEMISPSKCAATASQISGAKEWLSPDWASFLLRLPSCSITIG